jgi:DNA-binding PadR family transcriptional regulator
MKPSILSALLENFPLTFQDLTSKCESNRNRCRKILNDLKKKGFITESEHKRGQKAFFSLTEKGRSEALKEVNNALESNMRILKFDLEQTFTKYGLHHMRRQAAFHPNKEVFEDRRIEQENIEKMREEREKFLEPLNNVFFETAKAFAETDGRILTLKKDQNYNFDNLAFWFENGKAHFIVCRDDKGLGELLREIKKPKP